MKLDKVAHYAQRNRDITSKKYYCSECEKAFRDKYTLDNHLNGLKHHPERKVKHECLLCNYTSPFKANLNKHNNSRKHARKVGEI